MSTVTWICSSAQSLAAAAGSKGDLRVARCRSRPATSSVERSTGFVVSVSTELDEVSAERLTTNGFDTFTMNGADSHGFG